MSCVPEGVQRIIVTYPEKGWKERDHKVLYAYYEAKGLALELDINSRKLIIDAGEASLQSLTLGQFKRQGCHVEFIYQ